MKYLIGFWILCLSIACNRSAEDKPSLPDEKLARIMADLSVGEAATIGLAGYPKDSLMKVYFTQVFEMHGTTPEVYEKDLRLVSADLPRLKRIVEQSMDLLNGTKPKQAQ